MRVSRLAVWGVFSLMLVVSACSAENKMDKFAQCLASRNVTMYGAYWCPHCKDQKDEFGDSLKYIKYVECAIPGKPTNVQTDACKDMQIKKYPTWVFPDGERVELVLPLNELAEKSGCPAPPAEKK